MDHQSSELVDALDEDTRASLSQLMGTSEDDAISVLGQAFDADAALRDTVRLALADAAYLDADTKARTIYGSVWPPTEETEYTESADYPDYPDTAAYPESADYAETAAYPETAEQADPASAAELPEVSVNEDLIPALDEFMSSPDGFVALWASVEDEVLETVRKEFPDGIEEQDVAAVAEDLYEAFVDALCESLADESGWAEALATLSKEEQA